MRWEWESEGGEEVGGKERGDKGKEGEETGVDVPHLRSECLAFLRQGEVCLELRRLCRKLRLTLLFQRQLPPLHFAQLGLGL